MRVVVAGAGPGGASAALELARRGADVTLFERSAWPRAKTCGDGVSPLALREAQAMSLQLSGALHLTRALITTPGGRAFRGGWPEETPWGTIVERRTFDALLVDAAIDAGARFFAATRVHSIEPSERGVTVTVESGGAVRRVAADVAIVGDGATGDLAAKLGFAPHRSRLVAVRGYARAVKPLAAEYGLFYDRLLTPGYGWIFPVDERRANAGILIDERTLARRGGNARALFASWIASNQHARDSLGEHPAFEDVKGGIIPTGRTRTAPRIFLVGDAAGVADPFTAEGIFQAMHTGRLAAGALAESPDPAAAAARYERECAMFDRNERAARWLRATFDASIEICARHACSHPRFGDYLNTAVFFPKTGFAPFIAGLIGAW